MSNRANESDSDAGDGRAPATSSRDEESESTAHLPTAAAPSFPGFASTVIPPTDPVLDYAPGMQLADFEIVRELGRGAGGVVYLARQLSLERRVALKVSAIIGDEARTMAQLEHPHIVQVYSETVDRSQNVRLVCMQYVAGTTLEAVIRRLKEIDPQKITGRVVLKAIGDLAGQPARRTDPHSPLASASTSAEVTCLIGAQLAGALAFAHQRGVLHRDIKPANVLIDMQGRPLLADFNLSAQSTVDVGDHSTLFGGTLPYMAPEHLDAFNPGNTTTPDVVDERSDVYSLGVVIHQLFTQRLPFPMPSATSLSVDVIQRLADERRSSRVTLRDTFPETPLPLEHVIQQCLAGNPDERCQQPRDVQVALDGARSLMHVQQQITARDPVTRFLSRHPLTWVYLLGLLSQVFTVGLVFAFGMLRLFPRFDAVQQARFDRFLMVMALPLFLVTGIIVFREVLPMNRVWAALEQNAQIRPEDVKLARRRAARYPRFILWLTLLSWGIALILTAAWFKYDYGGLVSDTEYWLIGLISVALGTTVDVFVTQYQILCHVYPCLWADASHVHGVARRELQGARTLTRVLQASTGAVPLAAVVLVLSLGPGQFDDSGTGIFRFLSITLVVVGMGLFQASNFLTRRILNTVSLFTTAPSRESTRVP